MLRPEENEFLTRVGPGTPMGNLLRRFWTPALLAVELPSPDCPPVRVRLLGEDLVAFRDSDGKLGLLDAHCPHRRADLFFGRNEESGLRCVYHGWKFDVAGNCEDMPNEPAESNFKNKISTTAYPCEEAGGVIWAYLGPPDLPAAMPRLEWAAVPSSHRWVSKHFVPANYLQTLEGDLDSSHASFLHATANRQTLVGRPSSTDQATDGAPRFDVKDTHYGMLVEARRDGGGDEFYWRLTQWLLPSQVMIPADSGSPFQTNVWVPVDDEHTSVFRIMSHGARPLTEAELQEYRFGTTFAEIDPSTYLPVRNRSNDWGIDRTLQRSYSFTGIKGLNEQDQAMTVCMGAIVDRSQEHLGTSDTAIIATRRKLQELAEALQNGIEPYAAQHGEVYQVRPVAVRVKRDVPIYEAAKELLLARA